MNRFRIGDRVRHHKCFMSDCSFLGASGEVLDSKFNKDDGLVWVKITSKAKYYPFLWVREEDVINDNLPGDSVTPEQMMRPASHICPCGIAAVQCEYHK